MRSSGPSCPCRHATLDDRQVHSRSSMRTTYQVSGSAATEAAGEDGGEAGRHGRSSDWHDHGTGRICTTRPRRRGARAVIRTHVPDHPASHAPPSSNSTSPPCRPLQCSTLPSSLKPLPLGVFILHATRITSRAAIRQPCLSCMPSNEFLRRNATHMGLDRTYSAISQSMHMVSAVSACIRIRGMRLWYCRHIAFASK